MRYRKKPVEVEAMRFEEGNWHDIAQWMMGTDATFIYEMGAIPRLEIYTLEGIVTARPGDWIIKGVKGEFYPCRNDIFEETYEVAE